MRNFKILIIILFLILLTSILGLKIFATQMIISSTGLTDEEKDTIIANVNITKIDNKTKEQSIKCFDVNDDGLVAMGFDDFAKKSINVFDKNGIFQYGYEFYCSGSFGIEWELQSLIIYFVRSDIAIIVDSNGNIANVFEIQNSAENNTYWNEVIFSTNRTIGDDEYRIQNDMGILNIFATSYSQLVLEKENGETVILYDVSSQLLFNTLLISVCILIAIVVAIFFIKHQFVVLKRTQKE